MNPSKLVFVETNAYFSLTYKEILTGLRRDICRFRTDITENKEQRQNLRLHKFNKMT